VQIDGSISDEDYPPEAQRAGESGAALLKFFVDSSGNVTRCAIVESSGSLTLDDKSCKLVMARFRYAPALDKDGKPTSEWKTQRIRWQIPKPDPADEVEGLVPFSVDASYILQADGTVKDCKVVGAMPGKTPQADYCPTGNWHDPIKDAKGNPVTKRVHIKASLSITDVAPTPKRPARRRAGRRR
jgi:TonB family protein